MRLLVTRPEREAETLAARLRALGHEPMLAPVLEIVTLPFAGIDPDSVGGVVFTSRNAISAAAPFAPALLALPAYCVGEATAAAARQAGFGGALSAGGDASDLVELIRSRAVPGSVLLYLRGEETRSDIAGDLARRGIGIEERVVYAARSVPSLRAEAVAALSARRVDGILLFSPRSAEVFMELARQAGAVQGAGFPPCHCISEAAAAPCRRAGAPTVVAARPDLESLLDTLNRH